MLIAIGSLALLGVLLGTLLGIAARCLAVEEDPLEADLEALLPGSQCGQCGFAGCRPAAAAVAAGTAAVTMCPPGGRPVAAALAARLGVEADLSAAGATVPKVAVINEADCTGCSRCIQTCLSDGIVGARRQLHTVLSDACHGCGKCVEECVSDAIRLVPVPVTLATWHWPKPAAFGAQRSDRRSSTAKHTTPGRKSGRANDRVGEHQ